MVLISPWQPFEFNEDGQPIVLGYETTIGYEMAIVMYHQDCTMFVENAPMIRIPLMPGMKLPDLGGVYDRAVFIFSKIDTKDAKQSLN